MKTLKRLNRMLLDILSYSDNREDKIKEAGILLSNTLKCEVYFLDIDLNFVARTSERLNSDYFDSFKSTDMQRENILVDEYYVTLSPLISSRENLGFLVAMKKEEFSETEIIMFEIFRNFAITTLFNIRRDKNFSTQRQKNMVKNSISSFSYSELHAIASIFNELEGSEGVVIASNVSEKYSVTRSVIVSALRKFESSGVIESRSLGAKGTFIKVINPFLLDELELLKNDFLNKK